MKCLLPWCLALLAACPTKTSHETGDPPEGDTDVDTDTDADTDVDTDSCPHLLLEVEDGSTGTLRTQVTAAVEGGETTQHEGADVDLTSFKAGSYGVRAWLDEDGDGAWDGTWEPPGEPAAVFGLTCPREDLRVVLRRGVPTPVLDANPEWVQLYEDAWRLAQEHIAAGTAANGFAERYMDEAFSDQIFQWDSCFMTLFGRYGLDAFPVMPTLDNFYGTQADDGYICRVVNESDGQPGGDPTVDPSEIYLNPPLFAWVEEGYVRQTGDLSRLPRVLPVLDAYHDWIDTHARTATGLYWTSMLGSGMDNAPRESAFDGWVDITAQQALGRSSLARLVSWMGEDGTSHQQEADRICADIRDLMWDEAEGFFFDLGWGSAFLTDKTLASVWPLVAGCATEDQEDRVADHLGDPAEFWRVHVFPSTAADSPAYDPQGYYWRGGVWAPTTYATVRALAENGHREMARAATENHLAALSRVWTDFVPAEGQLASDATGDGTETLWELYAPDAFAPGTRWDNTWLGRQDFVGWTGLGPIALLLEQAVGLEPDALSDTLTWHLSRTDRHGVQGYRMGEQLVDLVAEARAGTSDPTTLRATSSDPFTLKVEMGGRTWSFTVPVGDSTFEVDPSGTALASDLVPAGPHWGYAVLGNGRIAGAWNDEDQGLMHLYAGDFGLDLVSAGATEVWQGEERRDVDVVGLDPFFAAWARASLEQGGSVAWRAFVGEEDAVVVQGAVVTGSASESLTLRPHVTLQPQPDMDGGLEWDSPEVDGDAVSVTLSDGRCLALAGGGPAWEAQRGEDALALRWEGAVDPEEEMAFRWVLAWGASREEALATARNLASAADPLEDAAETWAGFAPEDLCAPSDGCTLAAANLYAARASSLGGQVPADLTGQFVTDHRPQLYPRDAFMVARALESVGQDELAWEIVRDWLGRDGPSEGAWYARYDARGRAVDGGSGAAYDVDEWDSNAYLALLVERLGPEALSADERERVLQALDFLVDHQDPGGLWYEGGIVEWPGTLPSTAMIAWAGLDAGARLADGWGEEDRARAYRQAAGRVPGGLYTVLDWDELWLGDLREGVLQYDSSLFFGPAWGFPAAHTLDTTALWILENATALGGGVRYFEGNDYGQDLFFFTTAGLAQYATTLQENDIAQDLLDWMKASTNRYGLAPERVYDDGSGAAPASPLSWCAAETAMAWLALEDSRARDPLPVVDGQVTDAEYRPLGTVVLEDQGPVEDPSHPIALWASTDDDALYVGLRFAGSPQPGTRVTLYLSDREGTGPTRASDAGRPLRFRADASDVPGAVARADVDLDAGTCVVAGASCEVALGSQALEIRLDLGALGILWPQVIAAVGEDLLPAWGSWSWDDGMVRVTFTVDATEVALAEGQVLTLSGDREELGAWAAHSILLHDDGTWGDEVAGDGTWTTTVDLERGGAVEYKYLVGRLGDGSWEGEEFPWENRRQYVQDVNATGRVAFSDVFGVPEGEVVDP